MNVSPLTVRVAIPHFFREQSGGTGYGSGKPGARLTRSLALGRCLAGLEALARSEADFVLNIGKKQLDVTGPSRRGEMLLPPIELDVHLFTCGDAILSEVVERFIGSLSMHRLKLEDPRQLPLAARDFLIQTGPSHDLALYMEDDLVIGDPLFLDKQHWFLSGTGGKMVVMPHRYELLPGRRGQRLLVDGPLRDAFIQRFAQPKLNIGHGRFWSGEEVAFDRTANPHSGMFCINRSQLELIREQPLPVKGFVGPMETAATLTVLMYFQVLKPSFKHRSFLWVEHGHPTFAMYADLWKPDKTSTT